MSTKPVWSNHSRQGQRERNATQIKNRARIPADMTYAGIGKAYKDVHAHLGCAFADKLPTD